MKRAVIFDLDGVLIDSEPKHLSALQRVLAADGFQMEELELISRGLGRTFASLIGELIAVLGLPRTLEYYSVQYHREVLRSLGKVAEPTSGAAQLLHRLKEDGYKLGLASSGPGSLVWPALRALQFQDTFDVVIPGDLVVHGKPDPEIFLEAARQLQVQPVDCVVIEDSPRGIEAAKRANMTAVGVVTERVPRTSLASAGYIIESLADFPLSILTSDVL